MWGIALFALRIIGFTVTGVAKGKFPSTGLRFNVRCAHVNLLGYLGSLAALVQSVVYGGYIVKGSIFALCQSAAMLAAAA